jgi:hypothetical protein
MLSIVCSLWNKEIQKGLGDVILDVSPGNLKHQGYAKRPGMNESDFVGQLSRVMP